MDMMDITAANMKNTVVTLTNVITVRTLTWLTIGIGDLEPPVRALAAVTRPHTAPQLHVKVRAVKNSIRILILKKSYF